MGGLAGGTRGRCRGDVMETNAAFLCQPVDTLLVLLATCDGDDDVNAGDAMVMMMHFLDNFSSLSSMPVSLQFNKSQY